MKIRTSCNFCRKNKFREKYKFNNYSILECTNCKFLFRDKILSHKEEEKLYDKNYYLELQKEYFSNCLVPNPKDKSRLYDFSQRLDLLESLNTKRSKVRLLDIGAGTGAFSYLAKKRGWEVYNIEISPFVAEIARKKFNVPVYVGEVTDKRFKLKGFDVLTFWEAIANIENTTNLLKTTKNLLSKKGKIGILTTVVDSWIYDLAKIIYKFSFGKINYFINEGFPIHHANHFTRKALYKSLKKEGFKIIYVSNQEIPYKYTKLPKFFLPALFLLGKFAKLWGRTIQVLVIAQKMN
ncbi:MAG: hypothetical protein COU81_02930 [Candidatus Portnoybacteria bacterium CG10_big_fil_rev_8_21_14_0_10_36_7]|uniref:Class I SAM-dependent methyltransferase n=1 Tax=Candidatus Portnoybacteria bacterium CG10_big_fil_rev_8_21_14_0_10_36_7 TaxID=1974812 RepID=A0A2M8KDN4_9BACT|nr:MAG: hypothetical protein COU81_02930 [Candidatus Portnoybacteria bacterium CG10_big_fil_rev_8_21_14_0_10_36_7]